VEADTIVPADSAGARSDDVAQLKDLALGAPVVRVVNQLLVDAMQLRATDVHIEPGRSRLVIRYRIDGIMREMRSPPADMARAIVSRLKLLAGLDIAERRLPQDGRSRLRIDGREIDLRVATVPTINGEAMAIRLLENARHSLDLDQLGFGAPDIDVLRRHLAAPHGLMLVTGPTGSGKTTTLATALTILNEPTRKILTVEDPIEYQIEGINQIQVKPEIGVTFAHILRSFLRHDPDVIMVGELRDTETSRIAVQAALTGHLVLSTLHTNSAAGAVSRLLDMGIDAYLLASCLRFVIGQRLVRRLCPSCRREVEAPLDMPADVVRQAGQEPGQPVRHYRHHGCDRCHATGYSGRIGIIELLNIDESMSRLIRPDISLPQLTAAALERGMRTMAADGIAKCLAGVTTLEEVRRVALEA
jgi:general secretion pathway protein E